MTEAVFVLLVASGLCLTFSSIIAFYSIRTLFKSGELFADIMDLILKHDADVSRKEGTD